MPTTTKLPLPIDSWIDLIIASAAHRSNNAGQAKFGEQLIARYFTELPNRFKDDQVASAYLDEMLCAVAAAIRGFSVVRDIFQTNLDSIKAGKERELQHVAQLESLSPLTKDGVWGKIIFVLVALGIVAPLKAWVSVWVGGVGPAWLLAGAAAVAVAIIGLVLLVHVLRLTLLRRVESAFPVSVLERWEDYSLNGYRKVIQQFMPLALEITARHYPTARQELNSAQIAELIERHFAFKAGKKT